MHSPYSARTRCKPASRCYSLHPYIFSGLPLHHSASLSILYSTESLSRFQT
jgi:hypothetical protein